MEIIFEVHEAVMTARLFGELDHHAAAEIRETIDCSLKQYAMRDLVFDFANVTYMDSSGIGLIMGRHRSMESIGGEVIVRNPPQHIRRVMRLSGMERIARIQMDAPAAQPEEPAERRDEQ